MSWFVIDPKALSSAPTLRRTTTVLLSISSAKAWASTRSFVSRLTAASRIRFDALVGPNRKLARQQEVAAVSIRHILHVPGLADVRDILGQHHAHLSLA